MLSALSCHAVAVAVTTCYAGCHCFHCCWLLVDCYVFMYFRSVAAAAVLPTDCNAMSTAAVAFAMPFLLLLMPVFHSSHSMATATGTSTITALPLPPVSQAITIAVTACHKV